MTAPSVATQSHMERLKADFSSELNSIANWWLKHSIDHERGGFYGEVGADNLPVPTADKGVVLNTRILWFFAELAAQDRDPRYQETAKRAFDYLRAHFIDREHGGAYWAVNCAGEVIDGKKQVYAQAFAIYALVAYYQLTNDAEALEEALRCFELLEQHARDRSKGGYLEAFARDWSPLEDVRLSDKDLNYPKTMNTHLHVVEAYTTLHKAAPKAEVKEALHYGIECFERYLINKENFHLRMFLDENWQDYSPGYTYGHDIECSWLLAKAADSLGDEKVTERLQDSILGLANACVNEAMGDHGELVDAYDFSSQSCHVERIWWVQAEALVGFLKAYSLSGEGRYLTAAEDVWSFIKAYQIDTEGGEWFWLSTLDAQPEIVPYKLGFWKGPYHNGRAMIEAIKLLT
ncbi:AGE family epimerase/isomerase [Marinimicrobium sp. ABcell2]|uniref:AGE family epimerase/isomerase n=1 Tax=Marinimicrobium sp. ABcell2 TaxID=3069751 RepID=UPI0027B3BBDE|nr:AGE family epimerase/isomerase [Marinimicrobium sp. ABcell2]MDQ2076051.1 AGE family epimerase/isomerase [Marinimicrobium sp. ABcell2]